MIDNTAEYQSSPTRIYFVTTPNAVALPNLQAAQTLVSSITPTTTLIASSEAEGLTIANNLVSRVLAIGVTSGSTADVKQIYWGTTTRLYGVVEFDTPQTIAANKAISVGTSITVVPGLPTDV